MYAMQASIRTALVDLERACSALSLACARMGGALSPDAEFGLGEANQAAHQALLALRDSYRSMALTPV